MKVKLIKDMSGIPSGYTLGKEYLIFDESDTKYFLFDDDGDLRYIGKSLKGDYFDWEIVE